MINTFLVESKKERRGSWTLSKENKNVNVSSTEITSPFKAEKSAIWLKKELFETAQGESVSIFKEDDASNFGSNVSHSAPSSYLNLLSIQQKQPTTVTQTKSKHSQPSKIWKSVHSANEWPLTSTSNLKNQKAPHLSLASQSVALSKSLIKATYSNSGKSLHQTTKNLVSGSANRRDQSLKNKKVGGVRYKHE